MRRHLLRRNPGADRANAPSSRGRGSRGATALETAIIAPLFLALVFGIIEVGGAMKSYSSASNAVRAGGRTASVAGNDASADQFIMERMAREAAGIGKGEIDYVIIWKATGPGDAPSAACIAAAEGGGATYNTASIGVYDNGVRTGTGACNVYMRPDQVGGPFDMAQGEAANPATYYYGCTGPGGTGATRMLDCNWSPRNRNVQISPRGTPAANTLRPDYLGVYIKATHDYYTGLFGDTLTITDRGINLLEPDAFGVGT